MNKTTNNRGEHRGRITIRRRLAALLAAAAVAIAGGGIATVAVTASAASSLGAGWNSADWLGNWVAPNGTRVYCIDVASDSAASGGAGSLTGSITGKSGTRALSGSDLQKMNYAISTHGQTADPNTAAAVGAYVWSVTSSNWTGDGPHYINAKAPAGQRAAIIGIYNAIKADTEAHYADGQTGSGSGSLTFTVDANEYTGTLTLSNWSAPAGTSGTITLTNGIFVGTGTAQMGGVSGNGSWAVRGTPPAGATSYKIHASGSFGVSVPGPYAANITMYGDEIQRSAGPGTRDPGFSSFSLSADDPAPRSVTFDPILGTLVGARYLHVGDAPTDQLTFSVPAASTSWYRDGGGAWARARARGTLYGPTDTKPAPGAPTTGLPVAGTATVTTTLAGGPTIGYTATAPAVTASGYYSWEWTITGAAQPADSDGLIDPAYRFVHAYGQDAETSVVMPEFSTAALPQSTPGSTATDTLNTVGVIPADTAVRFEAFHQSPNADGTYATPSCLPANRIFTSAWLPVTSTSTSSPAVPLSMADVGRVLWVATVTVESGAYTAFTGVCGDPAETTAVTVPTVVTTAVLETVPGSTAHDVAEVTGFVPTAEGIDLTFEAFLQPVGGGAPVCAPANLVFSSTSSTHLGSAGTARSEDFVVPMSVVGTLFWVETARIGSVVVHTGECGAVGETTIVSLPTFVTSASPQAVAYSTALDTTTIDAAFIPTEGIDLRWEAHYVAPGDPAICTTANRAFESAVVHVNAAGVYDSPTFDIPLLMTAGQLLWVGSAVVGSTEIWHEVCATNPLERTELLPVSLTTVAEPGFIGESPVDRATVGPMAPAGSYLTWQLYRAAYSLPQEKVICIAANEVDGPWQGKKYAVDLPSATRPGDADASATQVEVVSDGVPIVSLGRLSWIATLHAADSTVLAAGTCETPSESINLNKSRVKSLTVAGFELGTILPWTLGIFGLGALLLAVGALVRRRRRRMTSM